jgi:hypothetical protein
MKELKCPQCGTMFTIDEADYASIVSQIKTKEFDAELKRRIEEMNARIEAEKAAERARNEQEMERRVAEKVREMNTKNEEIAKLREQLTGIANAKELEMREQMTERDRKIMELEASLAKVNDTVRLAVMEEQSKNLELMREKDIQIANLSSEVKNKMNEALINENNLRQQHKAEMRVAQEQIEFYRDLKSKMSTKMVGETLEEHCSTTFEMQLRPHMPYAEFAKDNKAVDGTKGDFIFRNSDGDTEYISIMFEMKNESEETEKKHKNADFFKKLDEDRKKKGCEYAVLVSTLEADSDLYNTGIVDVSHHYEKMYVVRPQFFVPIITLLDNAAKKSVEYKKELNLVRSQSVDITNFENNLTKFQNEFNRNVTLAHGQFEAAIKAIDDSIKDLQNVKDKLTKSGNNLRLANEKAMDLTIRRLTYMNPTMQQMFKEERKRTKKASEE